MMSNLLDKFDLITAERISGYLKERVSELKGYQKDSTINHPTYHPSHLYALLITELRELMIHIDGDLNSMLNDMEERSYR